ncbi:hypothetical protein BDY19DRAFT_111343 [Irpex rosettiformis]|uniref:Uncharacterized protein n=1 Tax=Irpex rosettiformis TaxID=378272 RepID=A0ACB8U5T4_9APHY|nr:hypothetical protein BDY19DRAFT_111343 [Irpex rosettiformis]
MFGCCVAGRLLQTNLQQIDETHACFELPEAENINHICVFLLGPAFPVGYGATVHLFWPGKGFQLLGMLSNDKPSAIFRLRGNFSSQTSASAQSIFSGVSTPTADVSPHGVTALLGLAIEPLPQIMQEINVLQQGLLAQRGSPVADVTLLAERIVKHLFNYLAGFAIGGPLTPDVAVPMGTIVRWYESFISKVRNSGIGFLENQEG